MSNSNIPAAVTQPYFRHHSLKRPKESFRVVKLSSNSIDGMIECHLQTLELHVFHRYTALSYEWGDPNDTVYIKVDGVQFRIQQNLHRFLSVIVCDEATRSELMFIDAICIDQSNIEERNAQVTVMGQIYQEASHVRAWIGQDHQGSADLFDIFDISDHSSWEKIPRPRRIYFPVPKCDIDYDQFPWYKTIKHQLLALMRRPFWSRAWIIQELALGATITLHCGFSQIDYDRFRASFFVFMTEFLLVAHDDTVAQLDTPFYNILRTREGFHDLPPPNKGSPESWRSPKRPNLFQLIQCYYDTKCRDARDRIYSLLGLACNGGELRVDYSNSLLAVFLRVLAMHAHENCNLLGLSTFVHRILPLQERVTRSLVIQEMTQHSIAGFDTVAIFVPVGVVTGLAVTAAGTPADLYSFYFDRTGADIPNLGYQLPRNRQCYTRSKPSVGDLIVQSVSSNCAFIYRPSWEHGNEQPDLMYKFPTVFATVDTVMAARAALDEELDVCNEMERRSPHQFRTYMTKWGPHLGFTITAPDIVRLGLLKDEFLTGNSDSADVIGTSKPVATMLNLFEKSFETAMNTAQP